MKNEKINNNYPKTTLFLKAMSESVTDIIIIPSLQREKWGVVFFAKLPNYRGSS